MQPSPATRPLQKLAATLGLLGLGGALALAGPTPGQWSVPDGGKQIASRPEGMNFAIITNSGPESILVTSKGLSTTTSLAIQPDGAPHTFAVPANSKNCVLRDEVSGTGAGAKGILIWAKVAQNPAENDPGGTGT